MEKIRKITKKILIIVLCAIMLFFTMPKKSEAGAFESLFDIVLKVPDAVMFLFNGQLSGIQDEDTKLNVNLENWGGHVSLYNFNVTPYTIFTSGKKYKIYDRNGNVTETRVRMPLLDINFFNQNNKGIKGDSADILRPVVSNVYNFLLVLSLSLMLVVLVYIGIRIIISSAVTDQVKYKQFLVDWVVGLCLILIMHTIMSAIMGANDIILDLVGGENEEQYYISFSGLEGDGEGGGDHWDKLYKDLKDREKKIFDKHIDAAKDAPYSGYDNSNYDGEAFKFDPKIGYITVDSRKDWGDDIVNYPGKVFISARIFIDEKHQNFAVYRGNIVEYVRTLLSESGDMDAVYLYNGTNKNGNTSYRSMKNQGENMDTSAYFAYGILYILLVFETGMFTYTYIKRVLKLAFLTMIAPLIAFMYPIDKIGDGKAQAFNTWFKDYLFTALTQPLHLFLYTIFVFSASNLMRESLIYGIAAYAYMIAAEKFFKNIFGFNKAGGGSPGMASPMASMLGMRGLDKLGGMGPHSKGGKGGSGGNSSNKKKNKIQFAKNKPSASLDSAGGGGSARGSIPSAGMDPASRALMGEAGGGMSGATSSRETTSSRAGGAIPMASSAGGSSRQSRSKYINSLDAKSRDRLYNSVKDSEGNVIKRPTIRKPSMLGDIGSAAARALTNGKKNSFNNWNKRDVKNMLRGQAGNALKFTGKKAAQLGLGAVGVGAGMAAGAVFGLVGSALSGEDKMASSMQKGAAALGMVGYNRGGQVADGVAGYFGDLHERNEAYKADKRGGGDIETATDLKMEKLYEENPDFFDSMNTEQFNAFREVVSATNAVTADNMEDVYDCLINNQDDPYDIAEALEAQKEFGNLNNARNTEDYRNALMRSNYGETKVGSDEEEAMIQQNVTDQMAEERENILQKYEKQARSSVGALSADEESLAYNIGGRDSRRVEAEKAKIMEEKIKKRQEELASKEINNFNNRREELVRQQRIDLHIKQMRDINNGHKEYK